MLLCHCKSLTDRQIRQAVHSGAQTVGQVGRQCGAGTCCGGCVQAVVEILEEERVEETYRALPVAAE